MIRLALLRHGHTAWNRAHRIQGRTDIALDDDAIAGLRALRLPAPWDDAQLWSSPLQRAVQTAELLTGHAPLTDPALMEMDWGAWEGQRGADLRADPDSGFRDIEDWGWSYAPPGGESPAELRARLVPWANALTRDSVAVCHIGVMRVLLAHATGWNFDGPAPFSIKRNRLYMINISGADWTYDGTPIRLEARP
ncbi:histidine phosphatase family protein [Pseudosulfitobacter koreensis]|uniref:Histidine phosphatase family protein n=1 Tax=Pseudosulfitobacter koreensis TaxID=2968472 RepID=A0ABT1Z3P5_9RHOB|nr:histidine phosphatase family protein [Pseudosulfitobacter koreense]MCR8827763.1 histidine phosphatase family protein [Pseudosulfitobacter koreense]